MPRHLVRPVRRAALLLALVLTAPAMLVALDAHDARGAQDSLPEGAVATARDLPQANRSMYHQGNWATPDQVVAHLTPEGDLSLATLDQATSTLTIDTLDPRTLAPVGATRTVRFTDWPLYGGLHTADDGTHYLLVGRKNDEEDDTFATIAVRRYDPAWTLTGEAVVLGGARQGLHGVHEPFRAGAADMAQVGNRLVVHMSRAMYADPQGVHHQGNLTFEVDLDTMTARTFQQLGDYPYASHSFQQYAAMAGSDLVLLDHGDAYPRALQLSVVSGYPTSRRVRSAQVMPFNGEIGANYTGTAITGMLATDAGVLVVGTSVRHPDAPKGPAPRVEQRNAFVLTFDPVTRAATLSWLTAFAPNGPETAREPRVVDLGGGRLAVLFTVQTDQSYRTEYRLLDDAGTVLAQKTFPGAWFGEIVQPVLAAGTVFWVAPSHDRSWWDLPARAYLFALDVTDPRHPVLGQVAGGATPTPTTTTTATPTSTSSPTADPTEMVLVTSPRLKGRAKVGRTLRVEPGEWDPGADSVRLAWKCDGRRLRGAEGTTHRLRTRDRGCAVTVVVTAASGDLRARAVTAPKRVR